jgi:hypothetical protein
VIPQAVQSTVILLSLNLKVLSQDKREIRNPTALDVDFDLPHKEAVMLRRRIRASRVKTSLVVLAVFLLIGVVVMAYGYFHNSTHIAYLGLFITGSTSFAILVQTLISQNGPRRV